MEGHLKASDSHIRALVLDFDGLIVDTETPIFEIWQTIYIRHGQRLLLDDWQHALGTRGGFDPVAHLARLTGRPLDAEAIERSAREQHRQACLALPLLPGVDRLLVDAERRGLGLAVASSSPRDWVMAWLTHHRIQGRFAAVCTREDVTRVKPAPDLFLLAAERLKVTPGVCLVFEDSPNGIRAARAAGIRCVAVPSGVTRALTLPAADLVLDSLAEVPLTVILERLTGVVPTSAARPAGDADGRSRLCAASSTECLR